MLHQDPNWPRASSWLQTGSDGRLAVIGVPLNASITPGRSDLAPAAIRDALAKYSTYDFLEQHDLLELDASDEGDLDLTGLDPERANSLIVEHIKQLRQETFVFLGGDNAITRPCVNGLFEDLSKVGVITLDAHLDLRDLDRGLVNGNPIRALLADGLPGQNIVQIGIQSFANSPAYANVAEESQLNIITAEAVHLNGIGVAIDEAFTYLHHVEAIYFDLDLDVMDRAFAPGTPGSRPGGLLPWQVRAAAKRMGAESRVKAMDLVELDPTKDVNDITALTAAACLLEFASGLMSR